MRKIVREETSADRNRQRYIWRCTTAASARGRPRNVKQIESGVALRAARRRSFPGRQRSFPPSPELRDEGNPFAMTRQARRLGQDLGSSASKRARKSFTVATLSSNRRQETQGHVQILQDAVWTLHPRHEEAAAAKHTQDGDGAVRRWKIKIGPPSPGNGSEDLVLAALHTLQDEYPSSG